MIKKSFAGCGLVSPRDHESFHSNLKSLIAEKSVTVAEDPSGITDDEEDGIMEAAEEEDMQ